MTGLEYLRLNFSNSLSSLTLPNTTTLHTLWAYTTNLSSLNLTNNTGLQYLDIANANFTNIDISMLPNLIEFYCNENSLLTSLDISNGNNVILDWMWANDNPNLSCIQVDDLADASSRDTNEWRKDVTASYSESCALTTEEHEVTNVLIYPNPVSHTMVINSKYGNQYTITDLFGKIVKQSKILSLFRSETLRSPRF